MRKIVLNYSLHGERYTVEVEAASVRAAVIHLRSILPSAIVIGYINGVRHG